MWVVGIDPGLSGGLAALCHDGVRAKLIDTISVPVAGVDAKRRVDVMAVIAWLRGFPDVRHAFVERAQAMPDQGASSGFNYGRAVGALEACVMGCQVPVTLVEARSWKRRFGLSRDKEASRQRAIQLFPEGAALLGRKMDHNRAEAALIALFGLDLIRSR